MDDLLDVPRLGTRRAPGGNFQALHRPAVHRQGMEHRGAIPEPATQGDGVCVLCVDEKSQIQALDRTQPILPLTLGITGWWRRKLIIAVSQRWRGTGRVGVLLVSSDSPL